MKEKEVEKDNQIHSIKKIGISGRIRLKLRQLKREIKEDVHNIIHMDKKEMFTKIFSTRYFLIFLFVIILLKTLLFSEDTVFYRQGIWVWYIRQTSFFIIVMISPLLIFGGSRVRFFFGMLLNLLISVVLFADELYYSYASNIISVMQTRKFAV